MTCRRGAQLLERRWHSKLTDEIADSIPLAIRQLATYWLFLTLREPSLPLQKSHQARFLVVGLLEAPGLEIQATWLMRLVFESRPIPRIRRSIGYDFSGLVAR